MIEATTHVYGDNVDTDGIIPARYLTSTEAEELARHCMEPIDEAFVSRVRPGDVMVGGRNFGSGSSREHAPLAIKGAGISVIVAESFARIFFRNAINVGLPIVECPGVTDGAETGDRFRVDLDTGGVENVTKGRRFQATPLPEFMQEILDAGGLMPWVARRLKAKEPAPVGVARNEPPQADWRLD